MKIAFSFDFSKKIGSGHFYRCLRLGQSLKKRGAKIYFILPKNFTKNLLHEVKKNKFLIIHHDNQIDRMLNYLNKSNVKMLVVDRINSKINIQKKIKKKIKVLVIIQDIPRSNYCDILLNQNCFLNIKKRYKKISRQNTKFLIGPQYFINNEFLRKRRKKLNQNFKINIFFGGSAQNKIILKVLKVVVDLNLLNIKIDCFVGIFNKKCSHLINKFKKYKFIKFYNHVEQNIFLKYLMKSDLAFGSAGITLFDRLYFGIPSIVTSMSKNQINNARILDKQKKIFFVGTKNRINVKKIKFILKSFFLDKKNFKIFKKKTLLTSKEISRFSTSNEIFKQLKKIY